MRFTALIGCAVLMAGCKAKESAPPVDTTAVAPMSLRSFAGIWNVTVKPEGKDTVVTSYVLNSTDTTEWLFAFPNGKPIKMRVTGMRGDTAMTETDWFESSVQKGMQARSSTASWLQDANTLIARSIVHYQTTGPDSVRTFVSEGTRQQ